MNKLTLADWQHKAASLEIEGRAFIDGASRDPPGGKTLECVIPIDGRVLAKV
ncbi:MAG: aldehyde dehydrogenase, partial [Burkholderia cenocepacia]